MATLGLSVVVYFLSVLIQFLTGFNVSYSFLSDTGCQLTGYPIAKCIYNKSFLFVDLVNIVIWFWVIHLVWGFVSPRKVK